MKNILLMVSLILGAANAQASIPFTRQLDCGQGLIIRIGQDTTKTLVGISYPVTEKRGPKGELWSPAHTVHIFSETETKYTLVDKDTATEHNLPLNNLIYASFHYPNQDMYVTAEGDTNEEGFFLTAGPEFLIGKKDIEIQMIYWSQWRSDDSVESATCQVK